MGIFMSTDPEYISAWAAVGALIVSILVATVSLLLQRRMTGRSLAQQRELTNTSLDEQRSMSKQDHAVQQELTEKSLAEQRSMSERGLAEQLLMSEKTLTEQRKMAGEERVWSTRAGLYVDLLVWLDGRTEMLEQLLSEVRRLEHEAEKREIDDLFARVRALVSDQESEPNDGPMQARREEVSRAGVTAVWRLLDPPVELRERLLLFASEDIRSAFEQYKATHAAPIVAGGDVDAWVRAIEDSQHAYANMRAAIVDEVHRLTSGESRSPDREPATTHGRPDS